MIINGKPIDSVPHVKLLGRNISNDLKWNIHVDEIVRKVSTRLYFLRQLKRANVPIKELLLFYVTCLRPITEYACQVFHNGLPLYLVDDLERLQKRALRTIYPSLTYREALTASKLPTLYDRRDGLTKRLFNEISSNPNHKLYNLLPGRNSFTVNLRNKRSFNVPKCKTNRFKTSFICSNSISDHIISL